MKFYWNVILPEELLRFIDSYLFIITTGEFLLFPGKSFLNKSNKHAEDRIKVQLFRKYL